MNVNDIKLKIKVKSLAEEARIIRKEIQRLKQYGQHPKCSQKPKVHEAINSLWLHNKQVVAAQARATHLARAYMKGQPYKKVEPGANQNSTSLKYNVIPKMIAMLQKYHNRNTLKASVVAWMGGEQ